MIPVVFVKLHIMKWDYVYDENGHSTDESGKALIKLEEPSRYFNADKIIEIYEVRTDETWWGFTDSNWRDKLVVESGEYIDDLMTKIVTENRGSYYTTDNYELCNET
jgi:hypothetical protein